jgi:hypothetical protein
MSWSYGMTVLQIIIWFYLFGLAVLADCDFNPKLGHYRPAPRMTHESSTAFAPPGRTSID